MKEKKLLFVADTDWFFISHRLPLAVSAQEQGYTVIVVAYDTGKAEEIRAKGIRFIHASLIRNGLNPLKEVRIIHELYSIYKTEKPDIVHHITLKMIIVGSLASRLAGVKKVVNAVTGLGHFFIDPGKQWVVNLVFSPIFKSIQAHAATYYIFQNTDDQAVFVNRGWTRPGYISLIRGSGVDLLEFAYVPEPQTAKIIISCGTRLLRDKGIVEFSEAARLLKIRFKDKVEFVLAGRIITENPTSIKQNEIEEWVAEGILIYSGFESDMYSFIKNCHINVLPSYREGMPRSLIEACAVGRPIVTTDVAGCRDVVSHGINGFLVPARDSGKLAEAIGVLIEDEVLRKDMGRISRIKAEQKFDLIQVISDTLKVYEALDEQFKKG